MGFFNIFAIVIYLSFFVFVILLNGTGLVYAIASFFKRKVKLNKVTDNPKVGIVVVCRNEGQVLIKTIKHLLQTTYQNKGIVIGDDSNNNTYSLILKEFGLTPKFYEKTDNDGIIQIATNGLLTVIHREKNYKYKSGSLAIIHQYLKNQGIKYYAVFDADWKPQKDFIEKLLPYFYTYKNAGAVQFARLHLEKSSNLFSRTTSLSIETAYRVDLQGRSNLKTCCIFTGGSCLFKTSAISNSGGWYAESLTEDIELSMRLYLNGYKILYDKNVKSYGSETPNNFHDFAVQQSGWQRGAMDTAKRYVPSIINSNKMSFNEKVGAVYQSFIYLPYLLVLLFFLFSLVIDLLLLSHTLPSDIYLSLGLVGNLFYWVAFTIFLLDIFKVGISTIQGKENVLLVPFAVLLYWAIIPFGFWANLKSLLNTGWKRVTTPKTKNSIKKKANYKIIYLLLFWMVSVVYIFEFFALGFKLNYYHVYLPLSLFMGLVLN